MPRQFYQLTLIIAIAIMTVPPLLWLVYGSFVTGVPWNPKEITLSNYLNAFSDARVNIALLNSIIISLSKTIISILIAFWLAWVTTRTNTPLRRFVEPFMPVALLMPGFMLAIVWILLLSPRMGLVNTFILPLFGLSGEVLNIYSLSGVTWVMAAFTVPYAYLIIAAALRNMDPSLEEASKMLGAGDLVTMRRVTFPLIRPAFLSAFLLSFLLGIEAFDVPLYIGGPANIPVLTTEIFARIRLHIPPQYGEATSIAMITLAIAVLLIYLQRRALAQEHRFVTVTGKGYRPSLIDLGKWKYPVSISVVVLMVMLVFAPVIILLIVSLFKRYPFSQLSDFTLARYPDAWAYPLIPRAFANTFIIGAVTASIGIILAMIVSYYLVRSKLGFKVGVESLSMIGIVVPGIVISLGFLWAYVGTPIYNTIWILVLAFVVKRLPWGIRFTIGGVAQIHPELEEAARVLGASWTRTFFGVLFRICGGLILGGWLLLLILVIRELAIPILLYTAGTEVLSIMLFDMWDSALVGEVAAISVILIIIMLFIIVISRKVLKVSITM